MMRPELYERYITIARAAANELAGARTEEELVALYRERPRLAQEIAERLDVDDQSSLDYALVNDAAFALRHRELVGELQRAEANARVQRARAAGEAWVTVFEQSTGDLHPPYRLVEMHVRSGRGIHSFVEPSPDTNRPVFGVEIIRLDPMTGDWMPDVDAEGREEFEDPEAWRTRVEELRAADARPGGTAEQVR